MASSELSLDAAWTLLASDPAATLIDVRTAAEWTYVGGPDLSLLGKQVRQVEWTRFPDGAPNPQFIEQASQGLTSDQPILLICRSGARSRAAADALGAAGFASAHNVTAGFEGDLDDYGHRHGGWREVLPWKQG